MSARVTLQARIDRYLTERRQLGFELSTMGPSTTHQYVEANLAMKEKALAKLQDPDTPTRRFRASDSLLEFLKRLQL